MKVERKLRLMLERRYYMPRTLFPSKEKEIEELLRDFGKWHYEKGRRKGRAK